LTRKKRRGMRGKGQQLDAQIRWTEGAESWALR
jgi:hypothetical protein